MLINDPVIVDEILKCHEEYESALMSNDVPKLDALFWDSPHAVRYGAAENLYGSEEIQAFRKNRPTLDLSRRITRLHITTLGDSTAIVNLEFSRSTKGIERLGRQTQFWSRLPEGWRIVSAHVSLFPSSTQWIDETAAKVELRIDPGEKGGVAENFERLSSMASFLLDFPLEQSTEPAPVFHP